MRARATYGVLIAAVVVGSALVLWPRGDDSRSVVDTIDLTAQESADDELVSSNSEAGDPYELVELRSAPAGVDLRVYRRHHFDSLCGYSSVRVGVSTEMAVGIVEVRVPDGSEVGFLESQLVGEPEGDHTVVIVGRVPSEVVEVSAAIAELEIFDRVVPVDGIVALALHTGSLPSGVVSLNLIGADGATEIIDLATSDQWSAQSGCDESPAYPEVTQAPTPTEPVGNPLDGDRPADREAIVAVYDYWYNADVPPEDKAGSLDDPEGVIEAQIATYETYGPTIDTALAVVDRIEFVSDTEAVVGFHIDVGDTPSFFVANGRAVLIDGSWRITRDTVCPLIANGGVSC